MNWTNHIVKSCSNISFEDFLSAVAPCRDETRANRDVLPITEAPNLRNQLPLTLYASAA